MIAEYEEYLAFVQDLEALLTKYDLLDQDADPVVEHTRAAIALVSTADDWFQAGNVVADADQFPEFCLRVQIANQQANEILSALHSDFSAS